MFTLIRTRGRREGKGGKKPRSDLAFVAFAVPLSDSFEKGLSGFPPTNTAREMFRVCWLVVEKSIDRVSRWMVEEGSLIELILYEM